MIFRAIAANDQRKAIAAVIDDGRVTTIFSGTPERVELFEMLHLSLKAELE